MKKSKNKPSNKKMSRRFLFALASVALVALGGTISNQMRKEGPPPKEVVAEKKQPRGTPAVKKVTTNKTSPKDFTVMVVSESGGGGSGSVIATDSSSATVLTNKHVCDISLKGEDLYVVTTKNTKHKVETIATYSYHDLCAVAVVGNLDGKVKIAEKNPEMYEKATVTGHPNLFPHILSEGLFSGKQMVPMLKGVKPCAADDLKDPDKVLFCAIFGVVPVYKTYEAQAVSSVSAPGSSGSAVLNKDGELAGVVFAGVGDFGYSLIVPVEHVRIFLEQIKTENERFMTLDGYRDYNKELQEETGIVPLNKKQKLVIDLTCKMTEDHFKNSKVKEFCNTLSK